MSQNANESSVWTLRGSLHRRDVLRLASASAASALGWTWWPGEPVAAGDATPAAASDAAWNDLARRLQGWVLRPGDAMYQAAAEINAAQYAGTLPAGIAICVAPEDAAACVVWARETGIPFAVRSGGHSYAGFSTSSGLVIDVKGMRSIDVDRGAGTVTIAAGANNADIADALGTMPLYVPGGRCPTVGVAGLTLGGGWGFSCRHLGLTCDSLISTTLAAADGTLVTASEAVNPDLFWAVRGAGHGNFGVHTSFTFEVAPTHDVTVFRVAWQGGDPAAVIDGLLRMQLDGPRELGYRLGVRPNSRMPATEGGDLEVDALGLFWGSADDLGDMLAPVERIQTPRASTVETKSFPAAREYLSATTPIGTYQIKSGFVRGLLPAAGITTMLDGIKSLPGVQTRVQDNTAVIFCWGGKVGDVAADATAFVHRDADFLFKSEVIWSPHDAPDLIAANLDWLDAYHASMEPYISGGAFQNFPDRTLADWGRAYYGANLERLIEIKRTWDPDNLFRYAQSIPLE